MAATSGPRKLPADQFLTNELACAAALVGTVKSYAQICLQTLTE